jgi:hypothetical protein
MVKGSRFDREADLKRIGWKWHMLGATQLLIMDGVI